MNTKKKGLTYGRLMLLMLALILLAVGAAWFRQLSLGPSVGFDDVSLDAMLNADYSVSEVNSTLINQRKNITPKDNGALIFIRTSAGNFAKLSVAIEPCLLNSPNQFRIYQGVVFTPAGEVVNNYNLKCVDLKQKFDLDSGLTDSEGATESMIDLEFVSQGPGFSVIKSLPNTSIALPSKEEILPAE
jgi:hypothetical protein